MDGNKAAGGSHHFMGNRWVASATGQTIDVIDPSNGVPFAEIARGNAMYGLVAGVWTRDGARQMRVARKLRCGQVFINNYCAGGGVELPFGRVKSSGYGREKGFEALLGFTTLKTIAIRHG